MGTLGWVGAAPKPHAASSDGDTAIELLGEVVTWSVLVWFGRQRGRKSWVCDGLDFFEAPWAVYSVPGAGLTLRPLWWPCLSRFMDLASEADDDNAQVCVVCFGFMEHAKSSWTNSPN